VFQYRFDHEYRHRKFREGDEVPGQDQIQLVNAVRHGGKLFQLIAPFFPCLHDKLSSKRLFLMMVEGERYVHVIRPADQRHPLP
jgi:hypothetical protein